jgi:small GTP-binding protein
LLGEGQVGKTSIINSFLGRVFPVQYLPTIGNETAKKEYVIKEKEIKISIILWDTGGQKSFNPFNPTLYTNVDGAFLIFDLTRPKETLTNLKKEFLENANRYSEEVLTLFVGNKLDLISSNKKLSTTIKGFLTKRDKVYLISAKTGEGVKECFELLIYTFLRKAELLDPDSVPTDTSKAFLNLIGKKEEQLKKQLVNLTNIDSALQKVKITPKIKEESAAEKEIKEMKYHDFLRQELDKNETQKSEVLDHFLINISELDKTIKHIQKTHAKSVKDLLENLENLLITSKKDFEENVDLIVKLNREEFELVKIISKVKEDQSIQQE